MKTIEEMRNRLQAIVAKLDEYRALEELTEENVKEINDLDTEYNTLKNNIEAREKLEAMKNDSEKSNRKVTAQPVAKVEVVGNRYDKTMGFKSFGELCVALKDKEKGNIDKRFQNTAAFEKFGEDGGFLIPEEFNTSIVEKIMGDESLLPRTTQLSVSSNNLSIPIDETAPWSGGIQAYWVAEGATYTESKPVFDMASYRLHKLGALIKTTDELLDDASALQSYIQAKAPNALLQKINDAIVTGNGAGKPQGLLNSGFKVAVAKESGQTAGTINYTNLIKMISRALPSSNMMWLAHPEAKEQLLQLTDANSNLVYMNGGQFANAAAKPFDMLLGRPIQYMMGSMPALGSEGDIILVDMSYYNTVIKTAGVKSAISTHLLFDRDQTAFKFIFRIDGSCPFKAPVTTANGSYNMSGIITLAVRA